MEFTGKLLEAGCVGNDLTITFTVDDRSEIYESYEKIKGCEKLVIKVEKHKEKRSQEANRYFHALSDKIAEKLTISKAKSKNILICKYGQPQFTPDGDIMVYKTNAPVEFMIEQESMHCIPIKYSGKTTFYKIYRGSHTYDTREMSLLIDGTVADAKELGIETMTPEELRQMKERWKI